MPIAEVEMQFEIRGEKRPAKFILDNTVFMQQCLMLELAQGRGYEPETSAIFPELLNEGDTFIDIGAHIGWFTVIASLCVGATGKVFAFEPDRKNFTCLLRTIAANNLKNVYPLPMAVSHRCDIADLYFNSDNDGGHALYNPAPIGFNSKTRACEPIKTPVMTVALYDFVKTWLPDDVKLVKMDTEGAELDILEGAVSLLSFGRIKHIIAEINECGLHLMGTSGQSLLDFMSKQGYQVEALATLPEHADEVYNVHFWVNNGFK